MDDAAGALKVILEANGITSDQYEQRVHEITVLELFHQNFPRILSLSGFTHLVELRITRQTLTDLSGFPSLPVLERLWVSENRLTTLDHLASCSLPRLTELFAYANRITAVGRALAGLATLEVLWLNENRLGSVEGLAGLSRLRVLNVACNGIEALGTALDGNQLLAELNLSGNRIGFLREIVHLRRLANLRRLALADPLYGDNPVSRLANYTTFVVYQLPHLQQLDACAIAPEAHQAAAASFLKRRMFYSMRIKAARRLAAAATRVAGEVLAERASRERAALKDLCLSKADEVSAGGAGGEALDAEIARVRTRISALEGMHGSCCAELDRVAAELTGRMHLELQTGGNIRLEEGKPSDVWYSSCADLVESRFVPSELPGVSGVSAVRVLRVLRVHNRFLRGRFDERLESLVETAEPGHKHYLEYLFHGQDPRFPDELFRVCEEGFHSAQEGASLGIDGAVMLSGSVAGADAARIAAHRLQQRQATPPVPDAQRGLVSAAPGCLVVAKVFLGRSAPEKQPSAAGPKAHAGRLSPALQFAGAGERHPPVLQEDYPGVDAVQRPEGKTWFVFDHRLVLPEYLVFFDYLPTRQLPVPPPGLVADVVRAGADAGFDGQALAQPVQHLWSRVNGLDEAGAAAADPAAAAAGAAGTAAAPGQRRPHPHAVVLGGATLGRSRWPPPALDPGSLAELDLHDCGLVSMAPLAELRALRSLVVSFNAIPRVCGLEALQSLTHLDLSHNVVHEVAPCPSPCLSLTSLRLEGNELASLGQLALLLDAAPSLQALALEGNPVCSDRMFRRAVLARAARLKSLDGAAVSQEERVAAAEEAGGITDRVLRVCCESGSVAPSTLWLPSRTLGAHLQAKRLSTAQAGTGWKDTVEEANLSGRRIQRIENLSQLPRLRRLLLADNEIAEVGEGLAGCRSLEDLVLEGNRLTSLAGLAHLAGLRRLEVGRNLLRGPLAAGSLAGLLGLTQLSVEDNAITSLAGLAQLPNLAEVYASNNMIATAADGVQPLAELQHLVILDLTGNPVAAPAAAGYRLHAVFTLKKLRVLDAVSVEPDEVARAKEEHGGRLTEEMVRAAMARVAHGKLDLAGMKLRRIDCLAAAPGEAIIPGVWDLALDSNSLTTARMAPLAGLANLRSLGLSHNRLAAEPSAPAVLPPLLEYLDAGYNGLSSISQVLPAAGAQYLRTLVLHGNEITRLEGLEGLPSLEKLVLNSCRIRSFSQGILAKVPALAELHLEGNGLKTLAGLEGVCNVRALFLGLNRLADFSEFDRLSLWGRLEQISVVQNPVTRKKDCRLLLLAKIPSLLVIDERIVEDAERERAAYVSTAEPIPPNIVLAPSAKAQANLRIATLSFEPAGPSVQDGLGHHQNQHHHQHQGGPSGQQAPGRPLFKPSPR